MSAQGKWRVELNPHGGAWDLYEGNRLVTTFEYETDARVGVAAYNAQCEAEPFAWHCNSGCRDYFTCDDAEAADWKTGPLKITPLYTAPPPPASAVAKVEEWRDDINRTADEMTTADEIIRVLKEAGL